MRLPLRSQQDSSKGVEIRGQSSVSRSAPLYFASPSSGGPLEEQGHTPCKDSGKKKISITSAKKQYE